MDLLVVSAEGQLEVFLGDGSGSLSRAGVYPSGANPTELSVGDIDLDGIPDVVIANHETTYLTLLFGDGLGRFERTQRLEIRVDPHPHAVEIHDVNVDGLPDLVVDHRTGQGLLILEGLGDGHFRLPGTLVPVGGDPYLGFAVGDLNLDGRPDLATPNPRDAGVVFQEAPGVWGKPQLVQTGFSPSAVALTDMTGDGLADLVAASGEGGEGVLILPGSGRGGFQEGIRVAMARGIKTIEVGNFDGDALGDVLVATWSGQALIIRGHPTAPESVTLPISGNPWGVAVGDLNQDGIDDFVIADGVTARIEVFLSAGN
jgi:FG-GAP-like repeat